MAYNIVVGVVGVVIVGVVGVSVEEEGEEEGK